MLSRPDDYSMSAFDVIYLMITVANCCSLVLQTCRQECDSNRIYLLVRSSMPLTIRSNVCTCRLERILHSTACISRVMGEYGGDCYFSVSCKYTEYTRSNSALGKHPSVFFNIFRGNRSSRNNRSKSACTAGQDNSDTHETNLLVCVCIPHCNSPLTSMMISMTTVICEF